MQKTLFFILIFAAPLFIGSIHAQQPFVNYTVVDGLPDENVLDVAVDQNNHLWFATQEGVAKFDRTSWVVYTTADGLLDNFINCIAIAPNGDVWAGTDAGVSRYDGVSWTTYTFADGLLNNLVNHIAVDMDGIVWIGVTGGVSSWNDTLFTNYTVAHGLPSPMVGFVGIDNSNNKWFCTWLGGVARFDGQSFTVYDADSGLIDNNVTSVAFDAAGNIYLGTYFGITVLDSSGTWLRNIEHADGLYHEAVMDIVFDSKGNMWAGIFVDYLFDGGLTAMSGTQFWSYGMPEGLVSLIVSRLAVDDDDNIWIATGGGVSMFIGDQLQIKEPAIDPVIRLFPNPVVSSLSLEVAGAEAAWCVLQDLRGRTLYQQKIEAGTAIIDMSGFARGVYMLSIDAGNRVINRKIVKQ